MNLFHRLYRILKGIWIKDEPNYADKIRARYEAKRNLEILESVIEEKKRIMKEWN